MSRRGFGSGLACVAAVAAAAQAQVTTRVSVSGGGAQGNDDSYLSSISDDGRYVAFSSEAMNLVAGDTNAADDVFVRDREAGTVERVSVATGGAQGDDRSIDPRFSADPRYLVFSSWATNLVPGDTNGALDVFLRDRVAGTTERVSVGAGGAQGNGQSFEGAISADGRYVVFRSEATNLVAGDTNGLADVFVRDRLAATTERVSVDSAGAQASSYSFGTSISADGGLVAFSSAATNLVAGDTNGVFDVFVRDRAAATTARVSVATGGVQATGPSTYPVISADGLFVAFGSTATNLVAGDTNAVQDVFVRDRLSGTTERASVSSGGAQGDGGGHVLDVSSDGRFVAFASDASNLVAGDANGFQDVFVRDRFLALTDRVSVSSAGEDADSASGGGSMSSSGRYVSFGTSSTNLVPLDTNDVSDVFVRDRTGGTDFTSLCDPGTAGVIACPCGNPPSGAGRGCDNSSGTGGATLAASGGAFLSSDSLVFATSGEKPTALSIVSQWNAPSATGIVFGMGVRCGAGTLKRLYTRTAVGGSVTAPDLGAGDLQVSVRSAALGDPIAAGQSRWYLVYYRDPIVLGGCPATSTFNATQTGSVLWSP